MISHFSVIEMSAPDPDLDFVLDNCSLLNPPRICKAWAKGSVWVGVQIEDWSYGSEGMRIGWSLQVEKEFDGESLKLVLYFTEGGLEVFAETGEVEVAEEYFEDDNGGLVQLPVEYPVLSLALVVESVVYSWVKQMFRNLWDGVDERFLDWVSNLFDVVYG